MPRLPPVMSAALPDNIFAPPLAIDHRLFHIQIYP